MRKRKRYFTIMVVPHSEESTYSMRIPLWVGQVMAVVLVLGFAAVFILAYVYRNVSMEAKEARILRQVNQVQQEEINSFAFETQKLLEQMGQIEDLAQMVADQLGIDLAQEEQNEGETDSSSQSVQNEAERYYASRSGERRVLDRAAANIEVLQTLLPEQSDSMELLKGEVEESLRRLAATPTLWPAWGRYTSGFGMRRSPFNSGLMEFHSGIDIAGGHGSAIYATADGTVTSASYRSGWGNLITLSHGYGFETYYAHLSGYAVSAGQWVKRGQVIGYMGRTGNVTGTHLHYEVHLNGIPVNPMNFIQ